MSRTGEALQESYKLNLAVHIAADLVNCLVAENKLNEDQGNFVFDRLTTVLLELDERELHQYMETSIGGLYV